MQTTSFRDAIVPKVYNFVASLGIVFCISHFIFGILFYNSGVKLLAIYEFISFLFYIFICILLRKNKCDLKRLSKLFTGIIFELAFHLSYAMLLVGKGFEFQHYIYGILIFILFEYYVNNKQQKTIWLVSFVSIIYVIPYTILQYDNPLYICSNSLEEFFSILNSFLVVMLVVIYVILFTSIVTDFERSLVKVAIYDSLTGVRNRTLLKDISYNNNSWVAIIDIDNFKKINDKYGHDTGDSVLINLGDLLLSLERMYPAIKSMRWGGEEFVLIFNGDRDTFMKILQSLYEDIHKSSVNYGYVKITYKATIGVADATQGKSIEELISKADACLYEGKTSGKDKIVYRG